MTLKEEYENKIKQELQKTMNKSTVVAVPKIEKIVINMGVGRMRENKAYIEECVKDLVVIAGQSPSKRKAKMSISNFKLRKGQLNGLTVTLRGKRMWDFYEKLVTIVLPRVKDFRGLSVKSFDKTGNYSIGFREHVVFPEIDPNKVTHIKPLQVTITTSAKDDKEGLILLTALKMPFKK